MHFICPDCGFEKNGEGEPQHCPVCEAEMVIWENPVKKDKRMTRKEMIGKLKEARGHSALQMATGLMTGNLGFERILYEEAR